MKTVLPEGNEDIEPENTKTLRYAVRSQGDKGFLFMINFQDDVEISDMNDISVEVETGKETIRFPSSGAFDLKKSTSAILPFNLKRGQTQIKSATVQPLTTLRTDQGNYYVFYSIDGIVPELVIDFSPELIELHNAKTSKKNDFSIVEGKNGEVFSFKNGKDQFLIIPQQMALNASKINDRLIISDGLILDNGKQMNLITRSPNSTIHIYPDIDKAPYLSNAALNKMQPGLKGGSSYQVTFEEKEPPVTVKKVTDRKYTVVTKGGLDQLNDVFVEIDYVGDRGMAFIDGLLVTDHLYHEKKWEIGMKSFMSELSGKEMVVIFHPMRSDQETLIDFSDVPEFKDDQYLEIKSIEIENEYKAIISF